MWYWQYTVAIINSGEDHKIKIVNGIVYAEDKMASAVEALENYYGEELCEIHMLKCITDGPVFEFEYINEDTDFDYEFIRKVI